MSPPITTISARTGQNTQETILTPANVNSTQFGKLFSVPVDGAVLLNLSICRQISIAGGTHNVLYVVTEHDNVYAIDADSGTVYAQVSLIPTGGSTVNSRSRSWLRGLGSGSRHHRNTRHRSVGRTLYVVAKSKVNGSIVQYLHALDVTTLAEKFNGPGRHSGGGSRQPATTRRRDR